MGRELTPLGSLEHVSSDRKCLWLGATDCGDVVLGSRGATSSSATSYLLLVAVVNCQIPGIRVYMNINQGVLVDTPLLRYKYN